MSLRSPRMDAGVKPSAKSLQGESLVRSQVITRFAGSVYLDLLLFGDSPCKLQASAMLRFAVVSLASHREGGPRDKQGEPRHD